MMLFTDREVRSRKKKNFAQGPCIQDRGQSFSRYGPTKDGK